MTQLAKVILKTTSGDEFTCSVHYERSSGIVRLPGRLHDLVEAAEDADERHVLVLLEGGFQYPLAREGETEYRVERSSAVRRGFWQEVKMSIAAPTKDQRLQYGRFVHTLSATAIIGMAGFLAGKPGWTLDSIVSVINLLVAAVVLFAVGAVLSKGEK
ncbi:hypothetical protein [Cupriavidus basilensis]